MEPYNLTARTIHWLSALTIVALFALGWWMVGLNYYSQWYQTAPFVHKSVGMILFGVTVYRLFWKHYQGSPKIEGSAFEIKMAKSAHHLMYVLLLALFVSGYLISTEDGRGISVFGWFEVPALGKLFEGQADLAGTVHYYLACTLIGLAAIHALAALKHHFIEKDNTLRKMTGGSK
ncbi:cytochrome b [Vibrio sp. UCD-FRSSP16_10]|uniref:cytochrome b n=1 Tax=unclassified Vibrio TaxID=2614977 RepID=UPI0008015A7F|nr:MULTISPECIES: cytochrome b [unclassified Vibrio]OBT09389.1 cytochrome b [Vibrio sp. UCD-FRSSP16_30]OBT22068.1 cytochrome b [Vibrio sp. UCD-FRSSP16_10]